MSFKLTKAESEKKSILESALSDARDEITKKYEEINVKIAALNAELDEAHVSYNNIVSDAYDFVLGIADSRGDEFDDKSERWQESDKGDAASSWINEYKDACDELEGAEFELIKLAELPDLEEYDTLLGLPEEMEE